LPCIIYEKLGDRPIYRPIGPSDVKEDVPETHTAVNDSLTILLSNKPIRLYDCIL